MESIQDQNHINDPSWGRWIPSYDSLPTGTPDAATSPYRDMLQNHTYYIYTTPRPFDWYVYGFAINTTAVQVVSINIDVSVDQSRENLSSRTIDAGAVLGWPVNAPEPGETCQINSHWLPIPSAHCFDEEVGGVWGWFDVETEHNNFGMSAWAGRRKCRIERPPYKVNSGNQFRFKIANRFTAVLPDTTVSVVGIRWLPWRGDDPAGKAGR